MEKELVQDVLRALEECGRAQREIAAQLGKSLAIPRAGIAPLKYLYRSGPVQVGCLAHHLRVDISVASRHITALVADGFVRRTITDGDRRARTVELTDLGRERVEELRVQATALLAETFESWDPDDLRTAIGHMMSITQAITTPQVDSATTPSVITMHQIEDNA